MPSAIDCYICHDSDGTYCLPKSYTTNGRFSGLINGKATERLTKQIILEQYQGGDVFHAGAFIGDFCFAASQIRWFFVVGWLLGLLVFQKFVLASPILACGAPQQILSTSRA